MDDDASLFCPHCGYDLRTLTGDACPECGGKVDMEALERSRIPWTDRRERGRWRAFWGTVWQSTFHTDRMAHAMARPVDYGDARRFQAALVAWLMVWLFFVAGAAALLTWVDGERFWLLPTYALALGMAALFFFAATGVPSYWFHPKSAPVERQNRAVALSYYASGSLAFLPLTAVLAGLAAALIAIGESYTLRLANIAGLILAIPAGAMPLIVALGCWRRSLSLASATAQRRGGGLAFMAIGLPIAWLALAVLFFVLIPGSIAWLCLVVYTLAG